MNPVRYKTNWKGPLSKEWYENNNLPLWSYSAGRIDFLNNIHPDEEYLDSMSVPPMLREDWDRFSAWLGAFETDFPWELDQIVELYERKNPKITWWKEKDYIDKEGMI